MSTALLERPAARSGRDGVAGIRRRIVTGWDGPRIVVVVTAVLAAVATVLLSSTVFSHLSVNNDETVYLLQAKTYASGRLFPPAGDPATSFTPWLGVVRGDHYVLKYTPVVPGVLALSLVLTGGYVAALAAWAMGFVGATFLLAKEATGSRTTAALAAVLVALTPLTLIQGAMILPYVPFAVLSELALWALLVGARQHRPRLLALAGLLGGLAFMARAFDALLMLLPAALWVLWRGRSRLRMMGAMGAGLVPPAAFLLWFDYVSTGSALKQPFSLFDSSDTLGFGLHRLYPGDAGRQFGIAEGWTGLWAHLRLMGTGWAFAGAALLVLVAVALIRRQVPAAAMAVLAGGAATTVGYLFFWGIWNSAVVWGGIRYIGPWYLTPLVAPACIVAAIALGAVPAGLRRSRQAAVAVRARILAAVLAAATLTGVGFTVDTFVRAVDVNSRFNAANRELADAVAARGRALVVVDTSPLFLQHPTAVISNEPLLDGRTLYALNRGQADFTVLEHERDRAVWGLRLLGEYGKRPDSGYGARLQELTVRTGRTFELDVRVRFPAKATDAYLQLTVGSRTVQLPVDPSSGEVTIPVTLTAGSSAKPGGLTLTDVDLAAGDQATLTLLTRKTPTSKWGNTRVTVPIRSTGGGELQMLAPTGPITALGPAPDPPLSYQLGSG